MGVPEWDVTSKLKMVQGKEEKGSERDGMRKVVCATSSIPSLKTKTNQMQQNIIEGFCERDNFDSPF